MWGVFADLEADRITYSQCPLDAPLLKTPAGFRNTSPGFQTLGLHVPHHPDPEWGAQTLAGRKPFSHLHPTANAKSLPRRTPRTNPYVSQRRVI